MKFIIALTVILAGLACADALRCYQCNSHLHNETACKDLAPSTRDKFLRTCVNQPGENKTFTLCRKMHMFLEQDYTEKNQAQDRVHRDCGTVEDHSGKDCYYKSGYNTRTWVCSCGFDECNSASLPATGAVLVGSFLLAFTALFFNTNM